MSIILHVFLLIAKLSFSKIVIVNNQIHSHPKFDFLIVKSQLRGLSKIVPVIFKI